MDIQYTNDLIVQNGDWATVDQADEIGQSIRDRLLTFRGEWFLDLEFGPDYRRDVFRKNATLEEVTAVLQSEIREVITGDFTEFSVNLTPERKLEISYSYVMNEGEIITGEVTI